MFSRKLEHVNTNTFTVWKLSKGILVKPVQINSIENPMLENTEECLKKKTIINLCKQNTRENQL